MRAYKTRPHIYPPLPFATLKAYAVTGILDVLPVVTSQPSVGKIMSISYQPLWALLEAADEAQPYRLQASDTRSEVFI